MVAREGKLVTVKWVNHLGSQRKIGTRKRKKSEDDNNIEAKPRRLSGHSRVRLRAGTEMGKIHSR